jgi:integrase/recombinase XerD
VWRKALKSKRFPAATLLAIPLQGWGRKQRPPRMRQRPRPEMSLYAQGGDRKYLNVLERRRFVRAVQRLPSDVRLFCLMLARSGGRISETLALTSSAIDLDSGVVRFETLKRRRRGVIREVPVPASLLHELDREFHIRARQRDPLAARARLWPWSRTTGWRYVKATMAATNIRGVAASPKGLRHTFGVTAFQARLPPHLVQRWLGHTSLRTTSIYADVTGSEERAFASRMWRSF